MIFFYSFKFDNKRDIVKLTQFHKSNVGTECYIENKEVIVLEITNQELDLLMNYYKKLTKKEK